MTASTNPISRDQAKSPGQISAPPESGVSYTQDSPRDLYAESELQLRHERTERLIRRAQEQS